jgi:hypothetical protein
MVMEVATSTRNGSSVSRAGESRTAQLGISSSGEWQQQECGGGGGDEEHEEQEQLSSGAEVRGHAGEAETVRRSTLKARSNGGAPQGALERRLDAGTFLGGAPLWNVSRGGIMRRGTRGLVGFLGGLGVEGV